MYKYCFIIFLIVSCGQSNSVTPKKKSISTVKQRSHTEDSKNPTSEQAAANVDSSIKEYLDHADNDLIRFARKDHIWEEALFDRMERRDTVNYFVFQIGHDLLDADGKRFITDSWIYIDSTTRKIYEYDLARDSLIRWEKK